MAKRYSREELNARLGKTLKDGKPIIIGGAGDGFTAKLEEKGGLDIIGVYNSGRFRHFGAGSLSGLMPVGRNQDMVMDYAGEVLSMVKETPVVAGFCSQDSRTLWEHWFNTLASMGVSGFMNFPTVGLIDADSRYRKNLEESGLGYGKEMEVLRIARDLGFFYHWLLFHTGRSGDGGQSGSGHRCLSRRTHSRRPHRRGDGHDFG